MTKIEILNSEIVYQGRVFNIRRDQIRYPNGSTANYDLVEHGGAVTLVPIDSDGNILFVRQYRHAIGKEILELPAGTLQEGEAPELCAQRELREETGFAAGKLYKLGEFYLAPGYSSEYMYIFLASLLEYSPLEPDKDEHLQSESIAYADVLSMLEKGKFQDAKTIAALFLAKPQLDA